MDADLLHVSMSEYLHLEGQLLNFLLTLQKEDLGFPVMTIFKLLKKLNLLPKFTLQHKIESKSNNYRDAGNKAFAKKRYSEALHFYNIALLTAPTRSRPLMLAYGNRSALFFTMKQYKACLSDIKICESLGYPSELMPKLIKRKEDCTALLHQEIIDDKTKYKRFLELSSKRHKTIPFASASIDVINDKVIAIKPLSPGEVILEEQAYVSIHYEKYSLISCYHCQRFSKNLIPCETCCYALFCNKDCQEQSWKESHKIECKIINLLIPLPVCVRLSLKALLKAKNECSGWDELIKTVENAEKSTGYCEEQPYKNLCLPTKINQIDRCGYLFNFAVDIAVIIYGLSRIPTFISNNKKDKILHFIGRQLMIHTDKTVMFRISSAIRTGQSASWEMTGLADGFSTGFFPFSGTLGHSCKPNVLAIGLLNKIVLIAQENIPTGTEITVPFGGQFQRDSQTKTLLRKRSIFGNYGCICKCERCLTDWSQKPLEVLDFDVTSKIPQLAINCMDYKKVSDEIKTPKGAIKHYQNICKGLSAFKGSKSGNEDFFYQSFCRCIILFQIIGIGPHVEECEDIFASYYETIM